ncbi:Maltodextrin phosphorylase [Aedoeadaptatus ivorii]|uniref:Alpha-1,4 glucan phosphorylase n=1 Tax=Aedoeadaptatus ivorii TaxID=54006 RepID=A0A3S4ZQC2_9FIRM|nr:glycogen/starch/alpha-glucan phosphorylase [Peptoniphilus ivorii]VEJ35303.1 Maltodextrin phosphorylase [Peptoniphilus ivorii]
MDIETWKNNLRMTLDLETAKPAHEASIASKARALSKAVRLRYHDRRIRSHNLHEKGKIACYMSLEFLMGKSLRNHLHALGSDTKALVAELVEEIYQVSIEELYEFEPDAGLGNGGLGRLAACFMDASATTGVPLRGYGLRYEMGMFSQKFENGFQVEVGDDWLKDGDLWGQRVEEETVIVDFKDVFLKAVPYDYIVPGYQVDNVNRLRLWKAEAVNDFDFRKFNEFDYIGAVEDRELAANITRVLYPNDERREGKVLRFMQQYFFAQATIRDLMRQGGIEHRDLKTLKNIISIQLNDTHPVIGIPEAVRILTEELGFAFEDAIDAVESIFSYTNHTILQEAMEKWHRNILDEVCPDTMKVIERMDAHYVEHLRIRGYDNDRIERMRILRHDTVYMAHLGILASHTVNGVAELHSRILRDTELADFSDFDPNKFTNVTNGITPRRFFMLANPEMAKAVDRWIGNGWRKNFNEIEKLKALADDAEVLSEFAEIKKKNKRHLAERIRKEYGIVVDPDSIFDIQIKRIHEYKRQLMYAFYVHHLYARIKADPHAPFTPRTCIFGGKSATGYHRAKAIIKYINELARVVNADPDADGKLKVVFIEDYNVSWAEHLVAAADVSEQISTAGKEASGTGNMKFMMNGTVTLGTMDGANIEIFEEAGIDNNYVFGATVEELRAAEYDPHALYARDSLVKEAVDSLTGTYLDDGGSFKFLDLYRALMDNQWGRDDEYYILYDLRSYIETQDRIERDFSDKAAWNKKSFLNMAASAKFTADRTILEYAERIWHIEPKVL